MQTQHAEVGPDRPGWRRPDDRAPATDARKPLNRRLSPVEPHRCARWLCFRGRRITIPEPPAYASRLPDRAAVISGRPPEQARPEDPGSRHAGRIAARRLRHRNVSAAERSARDRTVRTLPFLTERSGFPGRRDVPCLPVDWPQARSLRVSFPRGRGTARRARAGDGGMPDSSHSGREPGTVIDPIGAGLPEERRRPCAATGFRGGPEVGDVRARRLTAGQASR